MFPYRLLTALFAAGLLLSTLGCSKTEHVAPAPVPPTLAGDWNYTQVVTTTYNGTAAQPGQTTRTYPQDNTRSARYMTFTTTTQQIFYGDGTALSASVGYTRSGNTLTIASPGGSAPTEALTQLTDTELTLIFTTEGLIQGSHSDVETHFTRR